MNERVLPLVNPRSTARRIIGAICALLFLAALVTLGVWSGGWLRERQEFTVRIAASTGLTKSSPVMLLGQPIGRVSAVRVAAHNGQPLVEARCWIDGAYAAWMRAGTGVVVRSNLMGSPWLDLAPGPADGPALAGDVTLDATLEQGLLDKVLEIQPVIEQLITRVGGLVETLEGTIQRIDPLLAQVDAQLAMTKGSIEQMTGLVTDARGFFEQVSTDQTKIVAGMTTALEQVNGTLLPSLDTTMRESRTAMTTTFGELDETLELLQTRLPGLLAVTEETLTNTRDITEASKHTWPLSSYWKRKARDEAAAAARAQSGR